MYRKFLKEYFSFSLASRRGIWILIILIIFTFALPYFYSLLHKEKKRFPDKEAFKEFDKALVASKVTEKIKITQLPYKNFFDPNKFSVKEWIKAGVKKNVAEKIEKYINKGGRFRKKNDLLRIYGFEKDIYNRLSPYMIFPSDSIKKILVKMNNDRTKKNVETDEKNSYVIELNTADSIDLKKIPSLNKILSVRILKYRNALGGFYRREQLLEVYGLRRNIYDSIKYMIKLDTSFITKIRLNEATEKQLSKHPYIGKYKASEIIKFKKFKTKISNCSELVENGIFSKEEIIKLKYYLKF